jgi:hypothetical protein
MHPSCFPELREVTTALCVPQPPARLEAASLPQGFALLLPLVFRLNTLVSAWAESKQARFDDDCRRAHHQRVGRTVCWTVDSDGGSTAAQPLVLPA